MYKNQVFLHDLHPESHEIPKRGKTITYYVSGEKRMARGENGEAAVVLLNGHETGINTPIASNDKIEIQASTRGKEVSVLSSVRNCDSVPLSSISQAIIKLSYTFVSGVAGILFTLTLPYFKMSINSITCFNV